MRVAEGSHRVPFMVFGLRAAGGWLQVAYGAILSQVRPVATL
jgi:hypothetical protein